MPNIIIDNKEVKDYEDAIVLVADNWNDYGYYTTFNVFYYNNEKSKHIIGDVKIYCNKLDVMRGEYSIEASKTTNYFSANTIDVLPEDFCSLGQNIGYYENLKNLFDDSAVDILKRLRDIALFDNINELFNEKEGVKKSLLRSASAQKALSEAKKVICADIDVSNDGIEDYETINVQIEQSENDIYPYSSIKVERNQFSIYEMKRKYDKNKLIISPNFQRHFVWSLKQQSELIESIIMGIPLPLIYLAENQDGQLVVVDGQQRLTTFIRFINNSFRLSGLKILKGLNGKNYTELNNAFPNYVSIIEDYQLVVQVIKYPTPDRLRFDIFDRVNRGGTPLNKQEMRNALYQGKSTRLLQELAECDEFKLATGGGVSSRHMKDRYIVLRAIAFSLVFQGNLKDKNGNIVEYKSDMDDLMAKTMEYLNGCDEDILKHLKQKFKEIMNYSSDVLGADAFRVRNDLGRRRPISMTLFETIYYLINISMKEKIEKKEIRHICEKLFLDDEFMDAIQYSVDSSKNVEIRFKKIEQYVKEVMENGYR